MFEETISRKWGTYEALHETLTDITWGKHMV